MNSWMIPGLTDDAAELCLSRVPRSSIRTLAMVYRRWRSFAKRERFKAVRNSAGVAEDFLCILMESVDRGELYEEVFDSAKNKLGQIPPVPDPEKLGGFSLIVLGGRKIVFVGGFTEVEGPGVISKAFSPSTNV